MTEQKNQAPLPISDEELDAATGGAIGINPLLLLASGGQGIYMQSAEPAATASSQLAHGSATLMHGANPLHVETAHAPLVMPTYTPPTHSVAPTPTPTVTHPTAAVPAHESTVLVVSPSGMGHSLDIPNHPASQPTLSSTITISGDIGIPSSMNIDHTPPPVTVLTFDQTPGPAVAINPTNRGARFASEDTKTGSTTSLNNAFDLHLVNK